MSTVQRERRTLFTYRVSTSEQYTENQQIALETYRNSVEGHVEEIHIHASTYKKGIKELDELLLQIERGMWDEVCFFAVDRSGRDHDYDRVLWRTCQDMGCVLHYVSDNIRSDRRGDEFKFNILSSVAAQFRDSLVLGVKRGMSRAEEKWNKDNPGKPWPGRRHEGLMFGSTIDRLPLIRDAFKSGKSKRQIRSSFKISWDCVNACLSMSDEQAQKIIEEHKKNRKIGQRRFQIVHRKKVFQTYRASILQKIEVQGAQQGSNFLSGLKKRNDLDLK